MNQSHTISKMGLRLIKAYEGYRPVDRELVSGQRVVGYGRRLYSDAPMQMNKAEAEAALREDLAPFEDMINTNVHAPLSQSQFDALCSLAFNIGPKSFLQSDTLRAMNNGRPLDAANGFDIWRKSEIDGKTYVVDALVRRRTAEKAMFLRDPDSKPVEASRVALRPVKDDLAALMETSDGLPIFTRDDANGIIATAPYDAYVPENELRRRDDGPAGVLELSEIDEIDADVSFEEPDAITTLRAQSPELQAPELKTGVITEATDDLIGRLDALIDNSDAASLDTVFQDQTEEDTTLITAEANDVIEVEAFDTTSSEADFVETNIVQLNPKNEIEAPAVTAPKVEKEPVMVIDNLAEDDAFREGRDSAAKYIEVEDLPQSATHRSGWGYWIPLLLGFGLLGGSVAAMIKGSVGLLGDWGPILTFTGLVVGAVMVIATLLYALRANLGD